MSAFRQIPLGQPVPDSVHAVCCSLPTLVDVCGYEEKDPRVMEKLRLGYPRFLVHAYAQRAARMVADEAGQKDAEAFAVANETLAREMLEWMAVSGAGMMAADDFAVTWFPRHPEHSKRARQFLQHTGAVISSRQAEDFLIASGELPSAQTEETAPPERVIEVLANYLPQKETWIARSGMTAFYAALRATRQLQAPRGRNLYLQLGWLYLDTQCVLAKFLRPGDEVMTRLDVFDKRGLENFFRENGQRLAAVVTEKPTNPLVQTADAAHLSQLCLEAGAVRIFDPSLAGVVNVDLLPFADIVVSSHTKYAASAGDVMIGSTSLNRAGPFFAELRDSLPPLITPPYQRDLERLAAQIERMPAVAAAQNRNVAALAERLSAHPAVKRIHWARDPASATAFEAVARTPDSHGGIITIELNGSLQTFYDNCPIVKGPSFGTTFTMMCPFLYLAHYDLVTSREGRAHLEKEGLDPELVRLSVGTEPLEEIWAVLDAALSLRG